MKILPKVLIVFIIAMFSITLIPQTPCYADVQETVKNFTPDVPTDGEAASFVKIANVVLGLIQILSGVMAIIVIAWTGFKFIVETAEMKAQLKDRMLPIIVGAILVFGATSVAKFIIGVVENSGTGA